MFNTMFPGRVVGLVFVLSGLLVTGVDLSQAAGIEGLKQSLGKRLFFEENLSSPVGQSCASCHSPSHGFADPRGKAVSEGAHPGRFTSRNAPTVAYAMFAPKRHWNTVDQVEVGGYFYDGRADSLEEQAAGPLMGQVEMANTGKQAIVSRLRKLGYSPAFRQIYGHEALKDAETGFSQLTEVIASYERSSEVNAFNSKYDHYLAGKARLTDQELRGLRLFEDEDKGNCAACHPNKPAITGAPPLFTDFTYDNLGIPVNSDNPFLTIDRKFNPVGKEFVDLGLGSVTGKQDDKGKFKVPTLRNLEKTAPYMHNGIFKTMMEVVEFYNTRDVSDKWGPAEVEVNVNKEELGDLKLTEQEMEDLVSFLRTLTDGYDLTAERTEKY
ncbi:MAG: c-type cytochrome [Gammaproteobacteria bacterium]|nr:c-type cytochrome [Gammaproteobacteria bacterium]